MSFMTVSHNSDFLDTNFDFDGEVISTAVYRDALRSNMRKAPSRSRLPTQSNTELTESPPHVTDNNPPEPSMRDDPSPTDDEAFLGIVSGSGPILRSTVLSESVTDNKSKNLKDVKKALKNANTAVLLDNAQNFEGAIQAYAQTCGILQQLLPRLSRDENIRKFKGIVCFSASNSYFRLTTLAQYL